MGYDLMGYDLMWLKRMGYKKWVEKDKGYNYGTWSGNDREIAQS